MKNKLDKKNIGLREVWTLRLYANKFMADGDFKSIGEMLEIMSLNVNIYKAEIIRTIENYDMKTNFTTRIIETETLPLWVADEITNAKKINQANPGAKIEPVITDKNMNVPAIQTGSYTQHHNPLQKNRLNTVQPTLATKVVTWQELGNKDIVVNKQFKQIYPNLTGKMPEILAIMLQNVRD